MRAGSHRRPAGPAAVLLVVALASCGDGGGQPAASGDGNPPGTGDAEVTIETFAFAPDPLEVPAGTTITFTNLDMIDHTATAGTRDEPTPAVFDGALPERGATFAVSLDEPGTYDYFCRIHDGPGMTARIVVT